MPTLIEALYAAVMRPILFRLDPETAHRATIAFVAAIRALNRPDDAPELAVRSFGVDFLNPVGLAAGADKDARAIGGWNALGFGFAELGTITPRPQPGNPAPRVWRLVEHRAVINALGFPSEGMEAVAERLKRAVKKRPPLKVALNFGPNKDTPAARVAEDCAALMAKLGPLADFVVVNLSSPNTPGLREWQAPDRIGEIIHALRPAGSGLKPPLLVKLAPDLDEAHLKEICAAARQLEIDGIVAANTTLAREEVGVKSALAGGLSGRPLKDRSRAAIRAIARHTAGTLPIIGVGGIFSADDAWGHICAGASLVELYTGIIYQGPALAGAITAGLRGLLRKHGLRSINDAVGRDA